MFLPSFLPSIIIAVKRNGYAKYAGFEAFRFAVGGYPDTALHKISGKNGIARRDEAERAERRVADGEADRFLSVFDGKFKLFTDRQRDVDTFRIVREKAALEDGKPHKLPFMHAAAFENAYRGGSSAFRVGKRQRVPL